METTHTVKSIKRREREKGGIRGSWGQGEGKTRGRFSRQNEKAQCTGGQKKNKKGGGVPKLTRLPGEAKKPINGKKGGWPQGGNKQNKIKEIAKTKSTNRKPNEEGPKHRRRKEERGGGHGNEEKETGRQGGLHQPSGGRGQKKCRRKGGGPINGENNQSTNV